MIIRNNGNILFKDINLYMGMCESEFKKQIPSFKGNKIYNSWDGKLVGQMGFIDSKLCEPDWELSLQINVIGGLLAFYCIYIGDEFGVNWQNLDIELLRNEYHKKYIDSMGLKQKKYDFGHIRCSLNKTGTTNLISIRRAD